METGNNPGLHLTYDSKSMEGFIDLAIIINALNVKKYTPLIVGGLFFIAHLACSGGLVTAGCFNDPNVSSEERALIEDLMVATDRTDNYTAQQVQEDVDQACKNAIAN